MHLEKYSRNILLNEIDINGQENICNSSILCIGCGGLASFTLPILVANGIKKIGIIDFDTIELSNLPRQIMFTQEDIKKYKVDVAKTYLQKLNTNCTIEVFQNNHTMIRNIIANYDVITDLTDSKTSRIFANSISLQHKKPFFTGAAIGFQGHVYSFGNHLENKPCYECLFGNTTDNEFIKNKDHPRKHIDEKKLSDENAKYINNKEPHTCENTGVFPPIVATVGSMISSEILKYFIGMQQNFTEFLLLDFLFKNRSITMIKDPKCQCSTKL